MPQIISSWRVTWVFFQWQHGLCSDYKLNGATGRHNPKSRSSHGLLHPKCMVTVTSPIGLLQSSCHFQAQDQTFTLTIRLWDLFLSSGCLGNRHSVYFTLLNNFPVQYLTWQPSSHRLGSVFILFLSSAPPYACLYLPRYLPSTSPCHWPEGGERRWQGSLHHKTPAGHCPQQLPHKITATLSTSKWTGPVCHIADTGREGKREGKVEERVRRNHGKDEEEKREEIRK